MKLIDQFTRVYIVNLPDRSDRRREMEIELARNGLSVDANKIRYFNAVRPDDAGLFPSIGARGCFLSHLGILNEAIKDDLDNVLVMEDDLSIDDRFSETQSEMCLVLQNGQWDFAYIGHVEPLLDNNLPPVWEWTNKPLATTHFYAVNRPVMRPLRDYLESSKPQDQLQRVLRQWIATWFFSRLASVGQTKNHERVPDSTPSGFQTAAPWPATDQQRPRCSRGMAHGFGLGKHAEGEQTCGARF